MFDGVYVPKDRSSLVQVPGTGSRGNGPGRALVCDFDGTITNLDTGELVLTRFSHGDWRHCHELYLKGFFSFEECLRRQYATMRPTSKNSILTLIDGSVRVRPGFEELLAMAELARIPVIVASYGLDFCIEHVLATLKNHGAIRIISPRSTMGADSIQLAFPRIRMKNSVNLKDDVVGWLKQKGHEVIFIGDGASDYPAIEKADTGFAIEGSELARMCERKGTSYTGIVDFRPVVDILARQSPHPKGEKAQR